MLAPEHLNTRCSIKCTDGKGRGVFAAQTIPAHSVVEISPVLLFAKDEYEQHGKHTILDHYTFVWGDGRMALALGLGSLFNHSPDPNVSYSLDRTTDSIRYTSCRNIQVGEELCIFYGTNLWFEPTAGSENPVNVQNSEQDNGWDGLLVVEEGITNTDANLDEIVTEENLPFTRVKLMPEDDEEDMDSIRTTSAWVSDVSDPHHITTALKWLKQSGLDTPDLGHLKRIRKKGDISTVLLSLFIDLPNEVPEYLSPPYQLQVPQAIALTLSSQKLKNSFWPTIFAPRRKGEPEEWTRGNVAWARKAIKHAVGAAKKAASDGELPICAYIPIPYKEENNGHRSFIACDARKSTSHPLRHASLNLVRNLADQRTTLQTDNETMQNGTNYLLTSLTLFITHEPCVMCSMALLHSRVKEIFYLIPMEKTGGCGSVACLPRLPGVNHRFGIAQWNQDELGITPITVESGIDA